MVEEWAISYQTFSSGFFNTYVNYFIFLSSNYPLMSKKKKKKKSSDVLLRQDMFIAVNLTSLQISYQNPFGNLLEVLCVL